MMKRAIMLTAAASVVVVALLAAPGFGHNSYATTGPLSSGKNAQGQARHGNKDMSLAVQKVGGALCEPSAGVDIERTNDSAGSVAVFLVTCTSRDEVRVECLVDRPASCVAVEDRPTAPIVVVVLGILAAIVLIGAGIVGGGPRSDPRNVRRAAFAVLATGAVAAVALPVRVAMDLACRATGASCYPPAHQRLVLVRLVIFATGAVLAFLLARPPGRRAGTSPGRFVEDASGLFK
jgi:hypothetical protein